MFPLLPREVGCIGRAEVVSGTAIEGKSAPSSKPYACSCRSTSEREREREKEREKARTLRYGAPRQAYGMVGVDPHSP